MKGNSKVLGPTNWVNGNAIYFDGEGVEKKRSEN